MGSIEATINTGSYNELKKEPMNVAHIFMGSACKAVQKRNS